MSDLENMTAAELRTKLAEYGLPVMPITSSTKGLLIKKLRLLMEGRGDGKNIDSRKSLAKYSSGEESDLDVSKTAAKAKNRRATTGGAMLPPASSKLKKPIPKKVEPPPPKQDSDKESESEPEPVKTHEEVKTVTTRRITRTYKSPVAEEHEDYETGSDSDVDVKEDKNNTTSTSAYKTSSYRTSALPSYRTLPSTTTTRESIISPSYSTYTSSDLNSIRSRLGLTNSYGERPSLSTSYTSTYNKPSTASTTEEIDSPYLSSFTRRLASLRSSENRNLIKDKDTNGSSSYTSRYSYKTPYKRAGDYTPDFRAAGEKNVFKTNLVSFIIVSVGLFFFLGLAFLYLGKRNDVALRIEDENSIIPDCTKVLGIAMPSENCVNLVDVSKTRDLLKILSPELKRRAEAYSCGKTNETPYITEKEIVKCVKDFSDKMKDEIMEDLRNLHVMVINNPNWGISILGLDSSTNEMTPLTSMGYVVTKRNKGETALCLTNPSIPWSCSIWNILYYGIIISLIVGIIGLLIYGGRRLRTTYINYNKKKSDQLYSMVEQIIDVVSQDNKDDSSIDSIGQAMAISHVRDMLISPQNREKMTKIWDEAIKFLEKNESRVRFEVERVAGEEYRTIRWVSPQGSPRARGPGARSWQGQAFETQKGSVNNLIVSPTPCLKIRHMVEKNDKNPNVKQVIQDAILEKCGPSCKILHVEIDTTSWCVYVKCATPADAGIVYQSLHGWWYEGKLITVKYIRLERYMDHFPSSPASGPYLKASSQ